MRERESYEEEVNSSFRNEERMKITLLLDIRDLLTKIIDNQR